MLPEWKMRFHVALAFYTLETLQGKRPGKNWRQSPSVLMEPGRIYELHVDLGATSNVFLVGHRMRLEVSSSNFPRFDRNSNTGGTIACERENDFVQAINHVYHSQVYPSHLLLPVIERD